MARDVGEAMQDPNFTIGPAPSVESLAFAPGVAIGPGLRAAREFRRLSLNDVADITKVRRAYLAAIESMAVEQLPSRPFAIGYVRAYARALGLDEERAAAGFRRDAPDPNEPLRPPVGMSKEADPRMALAAIAGVLVLAAIIIWNVAQAAMRERDKVSEPTVAAAPPPAAPTAAPGAPVALGGSLPPPVEATIPTPYVPPGLPGAEPTAPAAAPTAPRVYGVKAQTFGAEPEASLVTLQAAKSVTMVIRGANDRPIFAKQLALGESYRVPMQEGLTIDVSSPEAVDVFVFGQYRGALREPVTKLSALMR